MRVRDFDIGKGEMGRVGNSFNQQPASNDIGQLNLIEDFSEDSLHALVGRLEGSSKLEHLVYREAELDEIWRLVDGALREARARGGAADLADTLTQLREAVMIVHDLVGVDEDAPQAARRLRESVILARRCATYLERQR